MFVFVQGAKHRLGFVAAESPRLLEMHSKARPGRGVVTRAAQGDNGIKHVLPLTGTALSACFPGMVNKQDQSVRHSFSAPTFAPRPSYLTVSVPVLQSVLMLSTTIRRTPSRALWRLAPSMVERSAA